MRSRTTRSRGTRTLVQQQLQLAKTELTEKASKMGRGVGLPVGGGLIAYGGLLAIIAAMVLIMIAIGLPSWAAALVGGVLVAGSGYLLIRSGLAAYFSRAVRIYRACQILPGTRVLQGERAHSL